MKTLFIECNMGAAGDMLMGALLEIAPAGAAEALNKLNIDGVNITTSREEHCGIFGTKVNVTVNGEDEEHWHHHNHNHNHDHDHDGHGSHKHDNERSGNSSHHHNHDDLGKHSHDHDSEHNHNQIHPDSCSGNINYCNASVDGQNDAYFIHPDSCSGNFNFHAASDHANSGGRSQTQDNNHDHRQDSGHDNEHDHHGHASLEDIARIINALDVPQSVKNDAISVYNHIAEAESQVHSKNVTEVHFHEVGALDAVADIVGCSLLISMINPDKIVVSPINTGSGQVECAHGILPVPAPATALILNSALSYSDGTKGELTTPTGAALLVHFADEFSNHPMMSNVVVGVGHGSRQYDNKVNAVRVFLGDSGRTTVTDGYANDNISELIANIDDMTGEEIGFTQDQLLKQGALDVFLTPVIMKKSRPAVMLTCLSKPEDADKLTDMIFKLTTTLGVRRHDVKRTILDRSSETLQSGAAVKRSGTGDLERTKIEYDDAAKYAEEHGISLREARKRLK